MIDVDYLMNKPIDLDTMKKVYDRLAKKQYNISYYRRDTKEFLECRQCSHLSEWQASFEANLYAAWAEYHYGCKVVYSISEQQ